jgi:hypothetical protein
VRYFIEVMYKHSLFFATALDSIEDEYKLRAVLETFVKKFPFNEGYEVKAGYRSDRIIALDIPTILSTHLSKGKNP